MKMAIMRAPSSLSLLSMFSAHLSAYCAFLSSALVAFRASSRIHLSFCRAESLQQQQQQIQQTKEMMSTPPTTPMPMIRASMFTATFGEKRIISVWLTTDSSLPIPWRTFHTRHKLWADVGSHQGRIILVFNWLWCNQPDYTYSIAESVRRHCAVCIRSEKSTSFKVILIR